MNGANEKNVSYTVRSRIFPGGAALLLLLALALPSTGAAGEDGKTTRGERSVTLTWDAPTTNTDGSRLTDLKGYKLYYGSAPGKYDPDLTVQLPLDHKDLHCEKSDGKKHKHKARTECTYSVRGLSLQAYYFAVRSYNKKGTESALSNEVKK